MRLKFKRHACVAAIIGAMPHLCVAMIEEIIFAANARRP
jgi:hypothetical protein